MITIHKTEYVQSIVQTILNNSNNYDSIAYFPCVNQHELSSTEGSLKFEIDGILFILYRDHIDIVPKEFEDSYYTPDGNGNLWYAFFIDPAEYQYWSYILDGMSE